MSVTRKKLDRELWETMILTRPCWHNSELVTFLGESSFLDSKWWWRETSMRESKEFEEMQRQAMLLRNCLPECKLMWTSWNEERRMTLSQLSRVSNPNSCFLSNQFEQDLCLISEPFKKHSSIRWNNSKNRRIQLSLSLLSLVKPVQVLIFVLTWINKTKLLIQH